jgi:hypothetical protein
MVKQFSNMKIIDKNSKPEEQLAVMRAKQLIGQQDPIEYKKMREKVIETKHPITKEFWQLLEQEYECEVCELEWEGKGTYSIKIRTPEGTIIDYASKNDILNFMEKYKKSNLEILSRVINYFIIASLKCSCCGELGGHLEGNAKIQIIKQAEFYGIKNNEDWENKITQEMQWIISNKNIIRPLLKLVPEEWTNSKKMLREIFKQIDLQNGNHKKQ